MDEIDRFIDKDGWGTMTKELARIFIHHGCSPACHICGNPIFYIHRHRFHLKPFVIIKEKRKDKTLTVQVMICARCSETDAELPRRQLCRIMDIVNMRDPGVKRYTEGRVIPESVSKAAQPQFDSGLGCFVVRQGDTVEIVPNQ